MNLNPEVDIRGEGEGRIQHTPNHGHNLAFLQKYTVIHLLFTFSE